MYGGGAVTDQTCQKWFAKFSARDFSLDDAPWSVWSGRPVKVDSNPIKILIENNQCYAMQEGAVMIQISKSIKLVKMKNVSFVLRKKLNGLFG